MQGSVGLTSDEDIGVTNTYAASGGVNMAMPIWGLGLVCVGVLVLASLVGLVIWLVSPPERKD